MRSSTWVITAIAVLCSCVAARVQPPMKTNYTIAATHDQITAVPGLVGTLPSNMFAGYLPLPGTSKQVWYMLIESSHSPMSDPLVLGLAGGPGITCIRYIFSEQGPFRLSPDANLSSSSGSVFLNPDSIHNITSGLYFDFTIGAGFSYSTNTTDYTVYNDDIAASDSLAALQQFYTRFPQYEQNELYLWGNSYAGGRAPQLAQLMTEQVPTVPLKGMFLTQPLLSFFTNQYPGTFYKLYAEGLISQQSMDLVQQLCIVPYNLDPNFDYMNDEDCNVAYSQAFIEYNSMNRVQYAVTYPTCTPQELQRYTDRYNLLKNILTNSKLSQQNRNDIYNLLGYNACTELIDEQYINRADVQAAFHANHTALLRNPNIVDGYVYIENGPIYAQYDFNSIVRDMTPVFQWLLQNATHAPIQILSGTDDDVCSTVSTLEFVNKLNLTVVNRFQPWYSNDLSDQSAGMLYQARGLSVATVLGGGHLAAQYKPAVVYSAFEQFLSGRWSVY